jgi:segregation and condensation protein A
MQMDEKKIPWWRRALKFALGGIRSGFGFFPRLASPQPVTGLNISTEFTDQPEEERALTEPSSKVVAAPANAAEPTPVAVPARAAGKGRGMSKGAEKPAAVAEEVIKIEIAQDAVPRPTEATASEPVFEPVVGPEPAEIPESDAVQVATPEPIEAAASEPVSEPVVVQELAENPDAEAVNEVVEEMVEEPEPVIKDEPEAAAEPVSAQAIETFNHVEPEPVSAPAIETVAESSAAAEPEPAPAPNIEPVDLTAELPLEAEPPAEVEPEPGPEPVAIPVAAAVAGPRRPLKPQPSEEEKAAARKAARQKKLDEGSEESPFSVIVGQVYDGPMDLLLDLIRKQDIDIYDIPIATITSQFLAYVNQLRASDVDVAGDFIYTASLLIHIKSKMLLPHTDTGPEQAAEDPRRELVERLLEHERFKNAAQMLLEKQMLEAASWSNPGAREFKDDEAAEPEIAADTVDLVRIFREILERARNRPVINVEEDSVTVGQMIQFLARRLTLEDKPVALRRLLSHTHSERALIAMFLALLEMVRLQAILLRQDRQFSEIFIKKHSNFETVMNEGLGAARDDWR